MQLWLSCQLCQPAVAGGIIYADLWGELSTHLPPQALFTLSSPVCEPLLQAFLFPSTLGDVKLHPFSQACMFVYSSHGKWVFPSLLWSFPPSATLTSFPTPGCWECSSAPTLSGEAQLISLQFREGFSSPALQHSGALPYLLCVFIVLIAYYSVSLFSPGGGSLGPGGYADLAHGCLWEYRVLLSSPCGPRLPKLSGCGCLVARGPSLFLCSM
jgi:hypothetical protein